MSFSPLGSFLRSLAASPSAELAASFAAASLSAVPSPSGSFLGLTPDSADLRWDELVNGSPTLPAHLQHFLEPLSPASSLSPFGTPAASSLPAGQQAQDEERISPLLLPAAEQGSPFRSFSLASEEVPHLNLDEGFFMPPPQEDIHIVEEVVFIDDPMEIDDPMDIDEYDLNADYMDIDYY
ncbi:hypothetical protein BDB01DRAFT_908961 [Pilobolus umbonatus]|nr:hypothetical protein BDB01DRAFT_908961 [Pilobolus umbonatus]